MIIFSADIISALVKIAKQQEQQMAAKREQPTKRKVTKSKTKRARTVWPATAKIIPARGR